MLGVSILPLGEKDSQQRSYIFKAKDYEGEFRLGRSQAELNAVKDIEQIGKEGKEDYGNEGREKMKDDIGMSPEQKEKHKMEVNHTNGLGINL